MGKRSKSGNIEDENINIKEKNLKKKETKLELPAKNKDTERITVSVLEDNETPITSKNGDKCITKKKGKRKHNQSLTDDNTPNKKILFDDNTGALEVSINKKKKGNKKGIQLKEDEPTEEDIDQFCEEINEEDNVEYENWIQLIEAKLSSNKNKT